MDSVTLTRLQLYDLVWAEPLSKLCKRYQISDVGLRKICVRLDIPLPKAGHWNKVKAGKKVQKQPFAENNKVQQEVTLNLATNLEDAGKDGPSEFERLQKEIAADTSLDLSVKEALTDPDKLIVQAHKALTQKDKYYRQGNAVSTGSGNLRISVTPGLINRALCFMDTFLKVMKRRGHSFRMTDRESYVVLGKEEMEMSLVELRTRVVREGRFYPVSETQATGKLALKFKRWSATTEIKDGKVPIEAQLTKLVAKLEILGAQFRLQEIEWDKQRAVAAEKRLQQEAIEARRKSEISGFKHVLQDAARWHHTVQLRAYVGHIEQDAIRENSLSQELQVWLDWIKNKADWLDPLTGRPDEWLYGVDPDALLASVISAGDNSFSGYRTQTYEQKKPWPLLPWYLKKD
jgi:hypothetical protein